MAFFACGCFWGVQHQFARQQGVLQTWVGYTGGNEACPRYEDVRAQKTGHAEAVAVEFDPQQTDFKRLCRFFFEIHDPAQTDGQGPDIGTQYRSCIFYNDDYQMMTAQEVMADLRARGYEVNTRLAPATEFWIAEEYHQEYYDKTGGEPYCHVRVRKF
ncbi:MAG: peptide-methionine (S)-S-oxide reductase MsrA [Bacteroidaceae bacterium]|nr:peptide-methionine (S)-S-oxide reductase MsrA [Bacteroidaceae bacterium]